jgi:chemotaxis protein MotB
MRRSRKSRLLSIDQKLKFSEEKEAWLISYSDVITMLLCFFMIFYSAEKKNKKTEFDLIITSIKNKFGISNLSEKDLGDVKKLLENRFGSKEIVADLEKMQLGGKTEILNYNHFVAIEFPEGNLFDAGSPNLNKLGMDSLKPIMEHLKKYQQIVSINIVAFTDPTPVKAKKDRWWTNNRELSALRALNVQTLFLDQGFSEESVFLTGRGVKEVKLGNQNPKNIEGNLIDLTKFNFSRTIMLRLEPKGK